MKSANEICDGVQTFCRQSEGLAMQDFLWYRPQVIQRKSKHCSFIVLLLPTLIVTIRRGLTIGKLLKESLTGLELH